MIMVRTSFIICLFLYIFISLFSIPSNLLAGGWNLISRSLTFRLFARIEHGNPRRCSLPLLGRTCSSFLAVEHRRQRNEATGSAQAGSDRSPDSRDAIPRCCFARFAKAASQRCCVRQSAPYSAGAAPRPWLFPPNRHKSLEPGNGAAPAWPR